MNDPERFLSNGATPLEQELLASVLHESVPPELTARMLSALQLGGSSLLPPGPGLPPLGPAVSAPSVGVGFSGLKLWVAAVGLGTAVTAGVFLTHAGGEHSTHPVNSTGAAQFPAGAQLPSEPNAALGQAESRGVQGAPGAIGPHVSVPHVAVQQSIVAQEPALDPHSSANQNAERESAEPNGRGRDGSRIKAVSTRSAKASAEPSQPTRGDLNAELKWLDPARSAIKQGNWARAQTLLDGYQAQFPAGALMREATVLRSVSEQMRAGAVDRE